MKTAPPPSAPEKFKLIDGTFAAPDAARILLSLVRSKIDYHAIEKLSNEERFSHDVTQAGQRVGELRNLHGTLKELCQSASRAGEELRIEGWINVTRIPARSSGSEMLPGAES